MNTNQLIRDSTYPMKSITPMKKPKVLQTFGNGEVINPSRTQKKTINTGNMDKKINLLSRFNFSNS